MKEQPLSQNQAKAKVVCYTSEPWSSATAEIRLKAPLAEAGFEVIRGNDTDRLLVENLAGIEFVVVQGDFPRNTGLFSQIIERARRNRIRLIYEIGDLPFGLPGNHKDGSDLMLLALNNADLVTTATQHFANFLVPYHPNIRVLQNYLPDSIWKLRAPELKTGEQEKITIGYLEDRAERVDLKLVTQTLIPLFRQYGQRIVFKCWGKSPLEELAAHPQVEQYLPVKDYREFAKTFADEHIDIFIAPHNDDPYTQFMSPTRFLEYSALGVPGVYGKVLPYEDLITNGENGFLASKAPEWVACLRSLIESPELRNQMAVKAQETLKKDWLLSTHSYKWVNAYYGALRPMEGQEGTRQTTQEIERRFARITNPLGWKIFMFLRRTRDELLAPGGRYHRLGRFIQERFHLLLSSIRVIRMEGWPAFWQKTRSWVSRRIESFYNNAYDRWIANNEPKKKTLDQQKREALLLPDRPKISVVTPVWNSEIKWLKLAIESVIEQTYNDWELCIANGSPENKDICNTLDRYASRDHRIKILHLEKNLGIAGNSNAALTLATGDFVGLLDHDDLLAPFALFEVAKVIAQHPNVDMLYSDEDKITADGRKRYDPFFKPAFSPDFIRSINYIAHFLVVRREIGTELGWIRQGFEGSQDFDLVLRVAEKAQEIAHIPHILYHWRAWSGSTALTADAKDYATESGIKAVTEHLQRMRLAGSVAEGPARTTYKTTYELPGHPLVTIIIPNKDHADDLKRCVYSIEEKSSYKNFEVLVVENNSQEEATFALYRDLERFGNVRILRFDKQPFSYAAVNNFGAEQAGGEILLFLNNDIEVINADWLERMLEFILRPEVGIVGAKLYYPDDTIQHAGVILGIGGTAGHAHKYMPRSSPGYFTRAILPQNYEAVTAACLMVKKAIFEDVMGLDPTFQLAFGDIDLCMKVREKGYLIVWTPYAELYHSESKTRGYENTDEKRARAEKEAGRFRQKWAAIMDRGDEYYNPNLTLVHENFSISLIPVNVSVRTKPGFAGSTLKSR